MATKEMQSSTPSLFSILEERLILPGRNRGLLAAALALMVASTWLLSLTSGLTLKQLDPIREQILLHDEAIKGGDPSSPEYATHIEEIQQASWKLMVAGAPNLVFAPAVSTTVRIVVHFVAVAACSGELYTVAALLGTAKAEFKGPLVMLVLVFFMEVADVALMSSMGAALRFLIGKRNYVLTLMAAAVALPAAIFLVFFSFLGSLSVVVAVAERGCKGVGAVWRAWRLLKGKRWPAVLFAALVLYALPYAVSPADTLASRWVPESVAAGLPFRVARSILIEAVSLFGVCAIAAFYYECKESRAAMATDDRTA